MSETESVRTPSSCGSGDFSGLRAIAVIARVRGSGQVDRIFRLTGRLRLEEHLRCFASVGVWTGDR